jgi:hypothetical protein
VAQSRSFIRARYAEAAETLEALLQMPYRISRRTSNHTYETGLLATDLGRIRLQLRLSGEWMANDHPRLSEAFQATLAMVEAEVAPRLAEAWASPASSNAPFAEADPDVAAAVRRWKHTSKLRFLPGRVLLPLRLR